MWKLTDFGITSQAASNSVLTSKANGTPSYRAPELLKEEAASYTKKVDIWAFGCVLYELSTGKRAFTGDLHVLDFSRSSDPPPAINDSGRFLKEYINACVQDMLRKDRKSRPRASLLIPYFRMFCSLLSPHFYSDALVELPRYLPYREVLDILSQPRHIGHTLLHLSKLYDKRGDTGTVRIFCKQIIRGLEENWPHHWIPQEIYSLDSNFGWEFGEWLWTRNEDLRDLAYSLYQFVGHPEFLKAAVSPVDLSPGALEQVCKYLSGISDRF